MATQPTRNLINRLAREEAALIGQTFLAPLQAHGRARIRIHGLVYELYLAEAQPGWWLCQICSPTRAVCVEPAQVWQRGAYLALWPALRLVLIEPLTSSASSSDWVALAYNPAAAFQRFGIAGPVVVRLVENGQPFERVIGRVEGETIWYDEPDRRGDPLLAEQLRDALATGHEVCAIAGLSPGERASYALLAERQRVTSAAQHAARTEARLRDALLLGGARLVGYTTNATGLRVTWEREGQQSTTLINPDLAVVSAGICLSGMDHDFDLASIVGVVQDAPAFAREWEG